MSKGGGTVGGVLVDGGGTRVSPDCSVVEAGGGGGVAVGVACEGCGSLLSPVGSSAQLVSPGLPSLSTSCGWDSGVVASFLSPSPSPSLLSAGLSSATGSTSTSTVLI